MIQKDDDWLERASWITKKRRGRPARDAKEGAATERITIRLTPREAMLYRRAAAGQSVANWIRATLKKALASEQ